jgi:hypothetical protein
MKKMILIVGLLYTATSGAVTVRVILTTYSPLIVPGMYYGVKTYKDREAVKEKFKDVNENSSTSEQAERDVELLNALNPANDFIDGYCKGAVPGVNIAVLTGTQSTGRDITRFNADEKVGFFSGLTTWATALGLVSVIKKLK